MKRPRAWRDSISYAKARNMGSPDPMRVYSPDVKICDAYFRLNDPGPYTALKLQAIQRRLS